MSNDQSSLPDQLPPTLHALETQCPHCGRRHRHTGSPDQVPPGPGSWSVCYYCGGLSVFEDSGTGLALRMPTIGEDHAMRSNPHMQQMLRALREARKGARSPEEAYRRMGLL